jgi:hypothetical protein
MGRPIEELGSEWIPASEREVVAVGKERGQRERSSSYKWQQPQCEDAEPAVAGVLAIQNLWRPKIGIREGTQSKGWALVTHNCLVPISTASKNGKRG